MAEENLGTAVLTLTANPKPLRDTLDAVKKDLASFSASGLKLDVKGFAAAQKELRNISTEIDKAALGAKTLNQVLSQTIPGGSYSKISAQIQKLITDSRELTIESAQYIKVLQRINELEIIRSNRVGRARVQAGFEAQQTFIKGEKSPSYLGPDPLPDTVAADIQLIKELTERVRNVDRASSDYEITLRQLEQVQRRLSESISGRSGAYRQLQIQEEAAIRRAEKLAAIQTYYAEKNPRAGGMRLRPDGDVVPVGQSESGAILARGRNTAADERAYKAALQASQQLLDVDLKREQTLRQISQRILENAKVSEGGFGSFSASLGADPVAKAIRRNQELVATRQEQAAKNQEKAYAGTNAEARKLLETELRREQVLRGISERILAAAESAKGGFGDFSRNLSSQDPVAKSIRRNQEKREKAEQRNLAQLDILDADLSRVRETRLKVEREKLKADKDEAKAAKENAAKARKILDERNKRAANIASNALIGGAFPLLFGQGIGASIGGAAGGAAGGALGGQFGFGLSLVGTALGTQFDVAIQKSADLVKALDNPIAQFGALQQSALLSSKGLEKQIEALIASGREAEAAAIIQEDLAKTFGDLEGAREYLNATDNLNRAWSEASITLANFVAGPLAAFLDSISGDIKRGNIVGRAIRQREAFEASATPQQRKELQAFINRRNREISRGGVSAAEDLQVYKDTLAFIAREQAKGNSSLKVAAETQRTVTILGERRLQLAELISRAELGGNKSLAATLKFQDALVANAEKRKKLELAALADRKKVPEKITETSATYRDDQRIRQRFVDSSKEELDNSIRELQVTKQLSGLEGTRLEVAKRRIELSKLFGERNQRGTEFLAARSALEADPNNLNLKVIAQGTANVLGAAGVSLENALRNASDYLKKAAKEAADNLTQAKLTLGALQASPEGLNRFLTPDEQFKQTREAITRLGPDVEAAISKSAKLLNIPTGQINERFQSLRDILSGAQQGVFASQAGFDRLQSFLGDFKAREEATTGLSDAQKTMTDVTSLNTTVQKELQQTIVANNSLLTALVGKDWAVNVAVSGQQAVAYGDVVNRASALP